MTNEEQFKLLRKGVWTYKDIMAYFGVKKTLAYTIIKICRANGGYTPRGNNLVLAEAVFAYQGLDRSKEIQNWKGEQHVVA